MAYSPRGRKESDTTANTSIQVPREEKAGWQSNQELPNPPSRLEVTSPLMGNKALCLAHSKHLMNADLRDMYGRPVEHRHCVCERVSFSLV